MLEKESNQIISLGEGWGAQIYFLKKIDKYRVITAIKGRPKATALEVLSAQKIISPCLKKRFY